jgi:hypothetical protein
MGGQVLQMAALPDQTLQRPVAALKTSAVNKDFTYA